jgi:hypothetical protein
MPSQQEPPLSLLPARMSLRGEFMTTTSPVPPWHRKSM